MTAAVPRVSIGLPVHNGERFLREALDTVLAQTFTDFEIVVTDNVSTDRTPALLAEYAARDKRLVIHRTETLLTAAENFVRALSFARGELFKWHAADDEIPPDMLATAVDVLDARPDAVGVCSRTVLIDEHGVVTAPHDPKFDPDGDSPDRVTRFTNYMNADTRGHGAHEMFALFRRAELNKLPNYGGFARADSVYLARVALLGRLPRVEALHFRNRDHAGRETQHTAVKTRSDRTRLAPLFGSGPVPPAESWDASLKGKINFPEWRIVREYARSKQFVLLTPDERRRFDHALRRFAFRNVPKLLRDLAIAAEHATLGRPRKPE